MSVEPGIDQSSTPESKKMNAPHYNVLLVEDYAPNVVVATALLDIEEYSYLVATSGKQGIEQFNQGLFDIILMDLQMPELDGIETTKAIREIEKSKGAPRTPVIAMTAHIANRDMENCLAAGIDDIIPKPFHPDYFKKTLQKYCKKY